MRFNKAFEVPAGLAAAPEEIAAGNATAQLGFYRCSNARVGDFEALLYSSRDGDPGKMLPDLRQFFSLYRCNISPKPGTTAARLVWFLLQEKRYRNVGVHQELKADIRFFYKVSLQEGGRLEVYSVPQPLETSEHPKGGIIVWAQPQRNPEAWGGFKHPPNWRLLFEGELDLIRPPALLSVLKKPKLVRLLSGSEGR